MKKWVYLITAPGQLIGETWAQLLRNEGIPAMVRSDAVEVYVGIDTRPVRIVVPEGLEEQAKTVLGEWLEGSGEADETPAR